MRKKNYWVLLGFIAAAVLVFNPVAQAKDEEVSIVNPSTTLDELGRFHVFESSDGGVLLVDSKTGRTWIYHRGNWHFNPFIKGQPFPGDKKFATISPDKKEKDE